MLMSNLCPICQCKLIEEHRIKFIDRYCWYIPYGHHYARRSTIQGNLLECKVRLGIFFIKVDYKEGYSEVWTTIDVDKNNPTNVIHPVSARIRINHIADLQFENLEKLKNKIKTYLTFS